MVALPKPRFTTNQHRRDTSVTGLLDTLGWRSLQERRLESRFIMWYKTIHGQAACTIPPYYSQKEKATSTRDSHDQQFSAPTATIDNYRFSYFQRTIKIWNILPAHIVTKPSMHENDSYTYEHSINTFRNNLHQQFLNGHMYVVASYDRPRLGGTRCATPVGSVY